jgi:hypothetical protein
MGACLTHSCNCLSWRDTLTRLHSWSCKVFPEPLHNTVVQGVSAWWLTAQAASKRGDDGATQSLELQERFYARPADIFEVSQSTCSCCRFLQRWWQIWLLVVHSENDRVVLQQRQDGLAALLPGWQARVATGMLSA